MSTITAESIDVRDPAELPEAFARAFEIFESRRPRPVHIGIPIDVLDLAGAASERLPARGETPGRRRGARRARRRAAGRGPDTRAPARRRRRGRGRRGDAVAEHLGAPIGLTVNAKGVVPDSHPLSLGTTLTLRPVHAAFAGPTSCWRSARVRPTDYFYAPGAAAPHFAGSLVRVDIDSGQLQRQREAASACTATPRPRSRPSTPGSRRAGASAPHGERPRRRTAAAARWWPGADDSHAVPCCARSRHAGGRHPRGRLDPAGLRRASLLARARATPATSLPGASARSAPPCPWRSGRNSRRHGAPWSRWPATAARSSRFPSSRARPTSACRSRS